ncbi:MAG: hypothetical protein JNM93_06725 [Bacteriovoracaceae bacterium]|nr:hypothetical protein [Bacteriovoracaceae bacterium]
MKFLFSFCLIFFLLSLKAESYVVLHQKAVKENLTNATLKEIYLGKKNFWQNGSRIYPSTSTTKNEEIQKFLEQVLDMSDDQYNNYWRRILFSGKGRPPRVFANDAEVIEFVESFENAIGIISQKPKSLPAGLILK